MRKPSSKKKKLNSGKRGAGIPAKTRKYISSDEALTSEEVSQVLARIHFAKISQLMLSMKKIMLWVYRKG